MDEKKSYDDAPLFLLQISRQVSFFEENLRILLLFININTSSIDVRSIFGIENFLTKTHILLLRFFIEKFPIFSFMGQTFRKLSIFLAILLQFFHRSKKWNFFMEKTSIEMCVFFFKVNSYQISGLTYARQYPCYYIC
jgi:hypothetical protein